MALIGTISGSNGTSTTSISGSLIIADEPRSRFPAMPSGVKLFVSGTKSSIGADAPSAIFGGDTFVSGAFGTDSYIQMKPVGSLRIPTSTTASYIYTSGSTNDLYFTQYQPGTGYTNTTRLRWVESTLQTGLQFGGVISSTSGSTTYNISSGSGIIINQNASLTDDPYPTIVHVEWGNLNNQPLPSIGTTQITYIAMDSTGTPYLKSTPFMDGDFENYIVLGRVLHTDKVGTNGAVNQQQVAYGASQYRGDFVRAFGPIKLSGHTLYVSGTTGLKKDAGDSYAEGRNYTVNPNSPNYVLSTSDTAQNTSKIFYEYVNAAGDDVIFNNGNLGYTAVDFAQYNNAGTLATVGAGNKFTIQRVFWFPNAVNRAFYVYYGNTIYSTIAEAQTGISTEVFTEGKNTRDSAIFLGYLIVKGTLVDFTDPTTYKVVQAGSFRAVGSSGAGSSGTPGGTTTQVQFNDGGVFNGNSSFRFLKETGTVLANRLEITGTNSESFVSSGSIHVKDTGGNSVISITNSGNITGSNILLNGGFIITGSGIIESNTSTTAFRVTQQGAGNAIAVEDSVNPDSTPFVVTADGRVGIGTSAPAAYVFVSGTDPLIPVLVAKGPDVTVNTLSVTGSTGASTAVGFVNIDQGNYTDKYGLAITNIGAGKSGLKLAANTTGGSFSIENMNTTPQIYMTHKNLWFNSVSTAFDTSQVTYKFIENNKAATYPNQKTFLISGNTNGPKTGSYFEVEKSGSAGPIKLLELQGDNTSNALFVSGTILTSGSVIVSNDIIISGSNILSSSPIFNIIPSGSTANTLNIGETTGVVQIGKATGPTTVRVAYGNTTSPSVKTVEIGTNGQAGSTTNITLGSTTANGRITLNNDVALATGNIIGSPGSGANVLTLISSGNIIAKLDINADATGHKFIVQDSTGASMFTSGEDGNAEVSGSLVVSGSSLQTITTTTYNLLTTALTGTLNVGTLARSITFGGTATTSSFQGAAQIDGRSTLSSITEKMVPSVGGTGTVAYDLSVASIFYANGPTGDVTANFTNVPTTNNRIITPTVILSQSSTPRIVSAVQIDTAVQTINWANGVTPTGTAGKQDVFGFSLIRSGSTWKVLGQMSTYG